MKAILSERSLPKWCASNDASLVGSASVRRSDWLSRQRPQDISQSRAGSFSLKLSFRQTPKTWWETKSCFTKFLSFNALFVMHNILKSIYDLFRLPTPTKDRRLVLYSLWNSAWKLAYDVNGSMWPSSPVYTAYVGMFRHRILLCNVFHCWSTLIRYHISIARVVQFVCICH